MATEKVNTVRATAQKPIPNPAGIEILAGCIDNLRHNRPYRLTPKQQERAIRSTGQLISLAVLSNPCHARQIARHLVYIVAGIVSAGGDAVTRATQGQPHPTPQPTLYRGLVIRLVPDRCGETYADVRDRNGEITRLQIDQPPFRCAEDALAEAHTWIDKNLPAGKIAPRSWMPRGELS